MVIVGKHINGISLNGLEYLLETDFVSGVTCAKKFESEEAAREFLREHGYTEDQLEDISFVDEDTNAVA